MERTRLARQIRISFAAALVSAVAFPFAAQAAPACDAPFSVIRFTNPLVRVAQKLKAGKPVTVVAIGSSSTSGSGASSPTASYPSRLVVELSERLPGHSVTVLNRGAPGEEVDDMLKRFDADVIASEPDLILWQFGTNSLIRAEQLDNREAAIRSGISKLRSTGADVVLIDPQFVPKVIAKPEATHVVELMAHTAKHEDVNLFPRFNLMKRWHDIDHVGFSTSVSPDGLHMNDWSYGCFAKALSVAIAEAAQRPVLSAKIAPHVVQ